MENDLTLVQDENQEEFPFVEPIKHAMDKLGWKAADLSRVSGVNESVISRILKGGRQASAANFYQVLCALGMICDESNVKTVPYKQKNLRLHDDVEKILNSDDRDAIGALNTGIEGILLKMGNKDKIEAHLADISAKLTLLLESETDNGEASSPLLSDVTGGAQANNKIIPFPVVRKSTHTHTHTHTARSIPQTI